MPMISMMFKKKWPLFILVLPTFVFMSIYLYYPFLMNIFNSFNTRSDRFNLFEHIGENKNFILVMGSIFILQTVIIQIGGQVFNTTMLSTRALLVSMALGFLIIPVDLVRKMFVTNAGR